MSTGLWYVIAQRAQWVQAQVAGLSAVVAGPLLLAFYYASGRVGPDTLSSQLDQSHRCGRYRIRGYVGLERGAGIPGFVGGSSFLDDLKPRSVDYCVGVFHHPTATPPTLLPLRVRAARLEDTVAR